MYIYIYIYIRLYDYYRTYNNHIYIYISHYITLYYNPTSYHNITTISQGPTVTAKQQRGALLLKELANTLEAHGELTSHLSRRRRSRRPLGKAGFKVGKHGKMMMKYINIGKIGTYFLEQTCGNMLIILGQTYKMKLEKTTMLSPSQTPHLLKTPHLRPG